MSARSVLRVSEIFESIQGEGPSAGAPSVFLRLATCNLRCAWCDTKYTWDWSTFRYDEEVSHVEIGEVAARLNGSGPRRLVVTGGEPLLQQRELALLFRDLAGDFFVELETNGTICPDAALKARVDQWNVSPKLEHSGEPPSRRLRPEVLARLRATERAYLKIVVDSDADIKEIDTLLRQTRWPHERVLVMPRASTRDDLAVQTPRATEIAKRLGVGVSPRLHVLHWNGKRGM